jgi:hypothetical protein
MYANGGSMSKYGVLAILFNVLFNVASAQISPGELSAAHAALEGIDHCTKCHPIGKALSDDKCTACHAEIRARIDARKGYHARIGSKHCFECHKEHHGRQFEIIRFDTRTFDHASVGYALEGKHAKAACRDCHTKGKISASDIAALSDRRKSTTMLGLSQDCATCHQDQHKGQFSVQCSSCHTFDQWKPASKFSHVRARFQLTGKHATVACLQCHKNKLADGATVQYVKMEFNSCASCHTDPHKGKFPQACSRCHTTDDFRRVQGTLFDHAATQFPLRGKHASLKCDKCHSNDPKGRNASGETGFHITKYASCRNCHTDAHAGQFDSRADRGRCEACHTEDGFLIVRFSAADHEAARFALTGAHLAIACAKCHEAGKVAAKSTRQFRWPGAIDCVTCHANVHGEQFAAKMLKGCVTCHTTAAWQSLTFSHESTKFPLRGRHAAITCSQCHTAAAGSPSVVRYAGTPTGCSDCHADEHERQFAEGGRTECTRCHTEKSWKAIVFDHDRQSIFALTGKHAAVACSKCHHPAAMNQRTTIKYKPLGTACIDCHPAK